MFRRFVLCAGAVLLLATAPAQAFDDAQRKEVESIVSSYLHEHPEVILEAIQALQAKKEQQEEEKSKQALIENKDKLFNDPNSPVGGNPNGDVTMVEFFDYNCGYCKAAQKSVTQLVKEDGKLRFVYKEFPILAASSVTAAKAAVAAKAQGKYIELHNAFMEHRGVLNDDTIMKLAKGVGLDIARLKADMEKPKTIDSIAADKALAQDLGISGTPAFVVGDKLVPGAVPKEQLAGLIAEQRKK